MLLRAADVRGWLEGQWRQILPLLAAPCRKGLECFGGQADDHVPAAASPRAGRHRTGGHRSTSIDDTAARQALPMRTGVDRRS